MLFKYVNYLFNVFNESKGNDHIAIALTCLDKIPVFFVGFLKQ